MANKGKTWEEILANRYWITPEGEKALEDYAKEHPEDE